MAELVGRTTPATYPKPLRRLTARTTDGHAFARFCADVLGEPLWPHQDWLARHALERLDDGRYRFGRNVMVMGRQQGKTRFLAKLALWRLFEQNDRLVLGVAQRLDIARYTWSSAVALAQSVPALAERISRVLRTNGAEVLEVDGHGSYRIAAMNADAGRGLTVDTLLVDEAQAMADEGPWAALLPTVAIPESLGHGMTWVVGTGPRLTSVVLGALLDSQAEGTGVWWWRAPDGADRFDPRSWAAAAPMLNRPGGVTAERVGRDVVAMTEDYFRAEWMGQRVTGEDVLIRPEVWAACIESASKLNPKRVALGFDGGDGHATLVAASPDGDRVRIEVVATWDGLGQARRELPGLVAHIRPGAFGYYPSGPSAGLAPLLAELRRAQPITSGDVAMACMELLEVAKTRALVHNGDELLAAQAAGALRHPVGDRWRFGRREGHHVDALYAAAAAAHLARTLPKRRGPRTILFPDDDDIRAAEREMSAA
jgi:hypothetical protein